MSSSSAKGAFIGSLLLASILLVPIALAVVTPYTEDFDTDGLGGNPVGDWYTATVATNGGQAWIDPATTGYMTGRIMRVGTSNNAQTPTVTFTFDAWNNQGTYQIDLSCNRPSASGSHELYFRNEDAANMFYLSIQGTGGGSCFANTVDGTGTTAFIPSTANGWSARLVFVINYATDTYTRQYTLFGGAATPFAARSLLTASGAVASVEFRATAASAGAVTNVAFIDGINFGSVDIATPEAPAGLSAQVTQAHDGDNALVELRWPVASDDPDQVQGTYGYEVYANSVSVGLDTTTVEDADGIRYRLINYVSGTADTLAFYVKTKNQQTGIYSVQSCSVTIDTSTLDFDSCGDAPAGGGGVGLTFTTPSDTAAGLRGWCEDLMGDSEGSVFLCGLMLVLTVFVGVAGALAVFVGKGLPSLIGGSIAGLGMAIFNVVSTVWGLVWGIVLIVITAAILLAASKALTLLSALRSQSDES